MVNRIRVLALVALACSTALQGATSVHAFSPQQWVIQLSDLKAGYVEDMSKAMPATHVGQMTGYETDFTRQALFGVREIEDIVYPYMGVGFAHAGYVRSVRQLLMHPFFKHHRWQAMSSGAIGNEREAYITSGTYSHIPITYTALIFQRNTDLGVVVVGGVTGYDPGAVGGLAGLIDRRMQQ